jgi:hypothetical protein
MKGFPLAEEGVDLVLGLDVIFAEGLDAQGVGGRGLKLQGQGSQVGFQLGDARLDLDQAGFALALRTIGRRRALTALPSSFAAAQDRALRA